MDTRYKKYAIIILLSLYAVGLSFEGFSRRDIAPEAYSQKEEQQYRDNLQLEIQAMKARLDSLESEVYNGN